MKKRGPDYEFMFFLIGFAMGLIPSIVAVGALAWVYFASR